MSKENTYKIRIGKKLIPASRELYLYYYRSRRRLKYYEHDIKIEVAVRDSNGVIVAYKPSKEDSLERLMGEGSDFADSENIEDMVVGDLMREKLRLCLQELSEDELNLIKLRYYAGKTETDCAQIYSVHQSTICRREKKILQKLKNLIEN